MSIVRHIEQIRYSKRAALKQARKQVREDSRLGYRKADSKAVWKARLRPHSCRTSSSKSIRGAVAHFAMHPQQSSEPRYEASIDIDEMVFVHKYVAEGAGLPELDLKFDWTDSGTLA